MKAILIDAKKREIREVEYRPSGMKGDVPTVGEYIGGWIEMAFQFPTGDVMFVDEEGLLKATMHFFYCAFRTDQPMAGNGVVVGREVEDEDVPGGYYTVDPVVTVEWLRRHIIWMDRAEFDRWGLANASEPEGTITTIRDGRPVTEVLHTYGQLLADMPRKAPDEENKDG
jgi:hypothetical protein